MGATGGLQGGMARVSNFMFIIYFCLFVRYSSCSLGPLVSI